MNPSIRPARHGSAQRVDLPRACVLAASLAIGCSSSDRQPLTGSVTLDGTPLATGLIEFEPAEGDGLASGAAIAVGHYEIPADTGLPPGRYRVRIHATAAAPRPPADAAPGEIFFPPGRNLIPPRYNSASELVVEVTRAGGGRHDFSLQSR